MKKYKRLINTAATTLVVLFFMLSCMTDFDDINKSKDKPLAEELNKDNMWAAYIQSMQISILTQEDNAYQRQDDLAGNTYAGYSGQASSYGGKNPTSYYFASTIPWNDAGFEVAYGTYPNPKYKIPGIMNSWNILRQKVDSTSVTFAIGEVVKVTGMHRITDMYGPIPYTKYGKTLYTEYDSQETVYKAFFEELDHAITIMTDFHLQNPNSKPIADFDVFYEGDMKKWIQFANSLKLRLAMRIRYVEPALAQKYAEEAVNHEIGVIVDNGATAKIQSSVIYPFVNPVKMLWDGYANMRMGASIETYLKGYNDPRMEKYFQPAKGRETYHGVRSGITDGTEASSYVVCSTPNINEGDPLYYMHAAEIFFLRAEGAIEGWNMRGSAQELYNEGIRISMDLNNLSAVADSYINDKDSKPVKYDDIVGYNSAGALSDITIAWEENASKERKLERIMTQKWLAMYPNGQEAWSEFRRTGYPHLFPPVSNDSNGEVDSQIQIRRIPLPVKEHKNNTDIVNKAIADYLNGKDSPGTKLWWDAKP